MKRQWPGRAPSVALAMVWALGSGLAFDIGCELGGSSVTTGGDGGDAGAGVDAGVEAATDAPAQTDAAGDVAPTDGNGGDTQASDGATADAPAGDASDGGAFDVKSLAGLVLWLDAAQGVTKDVNGNVTAWADQSGKGDDATLPMSAQVPLFVASAIDGKPAVQLDCNGQSCPQLWTDTNANMALAADFLVEVVATAPNLAPPTDCFSTRFLANDDTLALYFPDLSGTASVGVTTGMGGGVGTLTSSKTGLAGSPHLYGVRRTGSGAQTTLDLRVDGASDTTDANAGYQSTFVGFSLSGSTVAEVVVVNGSTSAAGLAAVEAYLKSKYGL